MRLAEAHVPSRYCSCPRICGHGLLKNSRMANTSPDRMGGNVIIIDAAHIRTIRMDRPDKKNAITFAMYEALADALESANASDEVRCVIIAGVPGAFSAGNDLSDFLS